MATLYSKVEDYIRTGIREGKWKPGDVLPKEVELCEMFGVSRPTVRMAMSNLAHEGAITRIKHKGTVVKEWTTLESATVFIESFQQEMEEKGKKVITEVLEFRCLEAPPLVAEKLELQTGDRVVKLTRLRYAGGAFEEGPVVLTTSYLLESLWPKIQSCNMERESLRQILKKNHCERYVMEKEITIHCLDEREARLLGETAGTDVIEIDTIDWDKNGKKMEYCESLYPAGRNRFLLRIRK